MNTPEYNEYNWREGAACKASDSDLFFPERSTPPERTERALRICGDCAVKAFCLDYALNLKQAEGIWGGVDLAAIGRAQRAAYFRMRRAAS